MTRGRSRRLWLGLHKWLGILLGGLFALLGLTGSVNVFTRELDTALNPSLFIAPPAVHPAPASVVLAAARRAAAPDPVLFLRTPDAVSPAWVALAGRRGRLRSINLDPANGQVLGLRGPGRSVAGFVYDLHSDLLLERFWGEQMVGVLGLVLTLSAASGLYLWWPRQGLARTLVQLRRQPRQILYRDLHALVGAWLALVILPVALTGSFVVFPGLARPLVRLVAPLPDRAVPRVRPDAPVRLGADAAMAIAVSRAPAEEVSFLSPPQPGDPAWRIGLRWRHASSAYLLAGLVTIDPSTGRVLSDDSAPRQSAGERFLDMQLWLHNGSAFGWPGRIAVLLAGLSLPALYATGLLFWLRKRRLRRRHMRRTVAPRDRGLPQQAAGRADEGAPCRSAARPGVPSKPSFPGERPVSRAGPAEAGRPAAADDQSLRPPGLPAVARDA